MSESTKPDKGQIYDLIGLGFGPSNLALMAAIEENSQRLLGRPLRALFLERKPKFCWHPGMLLPEVQIQLSFVKDLVTLRDPQSRFTFINYLLTKGRLDEFVNLRNFFPSRREFNDYYSWVAEQLDNHVRYNTSAMSVTPVEKDGQVELVKVKTRHVDSHQPEEFLTRNLVVATGGIPTLPEGVDLRNSKRACHSNDFLSRVEHDFPDHNAAYRFVVVGSGQSAAEIFQYLYSHYPNADVTATLRRFAYKPADESHFVNEIFFPRMENFLFDLPEEKRHSILTAHRDTNYSCVDREVIEAIYRDIYEDKVIGKDRLRVRPFLEIRSLREDTSEATLEFRDIVQERTEYIKADGVVLATGFIRPKMPPIIGDLSSYLLCDASGRYRVNRGFRVITEGNFKPAVFLQGYCEDSHGLSDTLLSTLPARAWGILEQIRDAGSQSENQKDEN